MFFPTILDDFRDVVIDFREVVIVSIIVII